MYNVFFKRKNSYSRRVRIYPSMHKKRPKRSSYYEALDQNKTIKKHVLDGLKIEYLYMYTICFEEKKNVLKENK